MMHIDPDSEREDDIVLNTLPVLESGGFSARLKQVLDAHKEGEENALVYLNKGNGTIEIFLKGGGWIGVDCFAADYDIAPFCD